MAIIGKIRKHSGLAVIIVGVAIAAFVIGDFGKRNATRTTAIAEVDGEDIPYADFSTRVDEAIENQKKNSESDKISDQEVYSIRESVYKAMIKDIIMGKQLEELALTVSPEELFDQVQGRQPHRFILQYFTDPKTGMYDPAMVLNYLKNLDRMEPEAKTQWLSFEKAIKEDRLQTKYNTLVGKAYYVPRAILKRDYENTNRYYNIRYVAPPFASIPDSAVKLTEEDYQKFYDKNKGYFYQDDNYRDLEYVVFDVVASDIDRKKTAEDVQQLYREFEVSSNPISFVFANTDVKLDSVFVKKGTLPGKLDSIMFAAQKGTLVAPFEFNNAWYMAKLIDTKERPDSVKGSMILISFEGLGLENVKRTKDQAQKTADSLLVILKKNPERFIELAKSVSDYPSAKEDGGDLKWMTDGDPNFALFFDAGVDLKVNEVKILESRLGYALFKVDEKTKAEKKVKVAMLQRNIEPSNQTFQDTYLKASAFAGENKTQEAFDKAAVENGLNKRQAQSIREMDNGVMGLNPARELVRWTFAENTKVGEVSPVFDLTGKYVVAIVKNISEKGEQPLEAIKPRIEPSVKNIKKIEILAERIKEAMTRTQDINTLAGTLNGKVDTVTVTFAGYARTQISSEQDVIGKVFSLPKGKLSGPFNGNFGSYIVIVDEILEPPQKEDLSMERMQSERNVAARAGTQAYDAIEKIVTIKDNRMLFY